EYVNANGLTSRIIFAGLVPDPFPWIMKAKVAVVSSLYEGLCNVIIEALGCGTAVVSTDCPYGPREILKNGRFGRLVPVGDAPALAKAIEAALDDRTDRASLLGRSQDYTADRAAENFLEIIAEIRHASA